MGTLFKILAGVAVVVAIVALLGLGAMSTLARVDGVHEIPVPSTSLIAANAAAANYADAWRIDMPLDCFANVDAMAKNAFYTPVEIQRDATEVVYEGSAPGLHYEVSYILDRSTHPPAIEVCTAVHIDNREGRLYWAFVHPIHRMIVPYMLKRMANAASV